MYIYTYIYIYIEREIVYPWFFWRLRLALPAAALRVNSLGKPVYYETEHDTYPPINIYSI